MAMKITQNEPDILVIKSRENIVLMGLLFVVVGLLVGVALSGTETLSCERNEEGGHCSLERSRIWGDTVVEFGLDEFEGAEVGVSRSSDGDDTYRVVLFIDGQRVPVTGYYSSGRSSKSQMVQEIDRFLGDADQASLEIHQDAGFFGLFFGGIFVVVGLATTFSMARLGRFRFCISENSFTLKTRSLTSRTYEFFELDEIDSVEVQDFIGNKGSNYRVVLQMTSGEEIPLTNSYLSSPRAKVVGGEIREFLDRRPQRRQKASTRSDDVVDQTPFDESFESDSAW